MNELKRVAIYARVSTKDQTCENQLRDLREFSNTRRWTIVKEFVDTGFSGAKHDRPALSDCMGFVRKRQADMLLVWRFDRFARSVSHLITTLENLRTLGVDFVSYQENVDTGTAQGRMVFSVMASLAEFERELIRERVLSGLRRAKADGVELGRPCLPEAKIKEVLALAGQRSQRDIATLTGVGKGTVQRILAGLDQKPSENVALSLVGDAVGF
jgi:DNA invertase Pin-like site-specific DNA recombinase